MRAMGLFMVSWIVAGSCNAADEGTELPTKPSETAVLEYAVRLEESGDSKFAVQPTVRGTTGESRQMYAVVIRPAKDSEKINFRYRLHLTSEGDTKWFGPGQIAASRTKPLYIEAIWIELSKEAAEKYDIYYQGYVQKDGWTGWKSNGEMCGTRKEIKQLQAIRIYLGDKKK